jgi:hypothetical protein
MWRLLLQKQAVRRSTFLLMHPYDRKAIAFDGRSVTSGVEDEDEYGASVE